MNILKQSTAATIKLGPFIDDTDGKTAETSLTISQADIRLSKNGGDIAQTHNSAGATHDELGYYNVPLDTTDTNTLGRLKVMVHESGALPVWDEYLVVTANVYDTLCSTDKLEVELASGHGLATATALQTVDDNVDAILVDTGTTLDTLIKDIPTTAEFEARTLVAANYFDPANDTVKLDATQGAVTFGQVKITANVAEEGALEISNSGSDGYSILTPAGGGNVAYGDGLYLPNDTVDEFAGRVWGYSENSWFGASDSPGLVLSQIKDTLTAIKGDNWSDETLVALMTAIEAVSGGSGATAQEVWEYATRTLTATSAPTDMAEESTLIAIDTLIKAIKAQTDQLVFTLPGRVDANANIDTSELINNILAANVEGGISLKETLRIVLAFASGVSEGGGSTTIKYKDLTGLADRIIWTVNKSGDRLTSEIDGSDVT